MGEINVNEYFDPRTKEPLAQAIQQTRELESVLKDKKYYGSKALLCYVRFHGLYVFLREKKVKDRLRPLKQKLHRFKSLTASVNR